MEEGEAAGFPRLLGDIGGTNARWAWERAPGGAPTLIASYACADFASLQAVIEHYLAEHAVHRPRQVAFGIATPVDGDHVAMTNHPWTFSIAALQQALGAERLLVLNDFAAVASALPALTAADTLAIGGGQAQPGAPLAVLGPGTGLGVAGSVPDAAGHHTVVAGEGGHVTLAAANAREAAVIAWLGARFGHASAERALSGPGLVNLFKALCAVDGLPAPALTPADVTAHALAGSDAACVEALRLFAAFLGSVAGNLALTLGARGGVYLAGGIVPRLGNGFDAALFRERFEAKGRFRAYLERIPTALITAPAVGIVGAARALDALGR